ncbi:MAG TPA: hypothetical protein VJ001_12430 [Rhodocyclaceae bacterium]|nr:hypothetical protein [Rhodocyclaceae bacterium]
MKASFAGETAIIAELPIDRRSRSIAHCMNGFLPSPLAGSSPNDAHGM